VAQGAEGKQVADAREGGFLNSWRDRESPSFGVNSQMPHMGFFGLLDLRAAHMAEFRVLTESCCMH
jgi:hypothetical protein